MLNVLNEKNIVMNDVKKFELNDEELVVYMDEKIESISYDEINPSSGCMMCKDYDAELADISIGCIDEDKRVTSLIVRTDKGKEIKNYIETKDGLNVKKLRQSIEKKQKRFENEIKRREEQKEHNSYYYIWKHNNIIQGKNGLINIILPTPIAGFYDSNTVIKLAQISKEYSCDLKVTNRENFHLENVQPKDLEEIIVFYQKYMSYE